MPTVAEKTLLTPEGLLALPDEKGFELVDGELVVRNVSGLSSWVGINIARLIGNHVEAQRLGWVFGADHGYQCFADSPQTVRRPDVSFVQAGRLGWNEIRKGWMSVVPDLIVEVVSPNDLAYKVDEKVEMFLRAGVPLIWVVNPNVRTVRIIRTDRSSTILWEGDELSGEGVIPGFACPVAAFFPEAAPAEPAEAKPSP